MTLKKTFNVLKNTSHSSGGWKSWGQAVGGCASEISLAGLQTATSHGKERERGL